MPLARKHTNMTVTYNDLTIEWHGYATARLESGDTVVYFDPGRYGVLNGGWQADSEAAAGAHPPAKDFRPEDGDVVCVTHVHHYDPDGIERVAADDATIVAFDGLDVRDSERDLERIADLSYDVVEFGMEDEGIVADVPIWTVPAYNHPGGPNVFDDGTPVHPEGFGCGFLVSLDGVRVFWPGDSDVLDGHAQLDVDVFMPSISQSFTMNRHEAADLAEEMAPSLVVPIHYNTFSALEADSRAFAGDVASRAIPVAVDEN